MVCISSKTLKLRVCVPLQGPLAKELLKQRRFARHSEPVDEELSKDNEASPSPLSETGIGSPP
jgi:hypothetical protein